MRVMLDTNILISIIVFNSRKLKEMMMNICDNHTLVLSSKIIKELVYVINRKFPYKEKAIQEFLLKVPYEFIDIKSETYNKNSLHIRDEKDIPILHSAIISNVDIFITGDNDFKDVQIEKPIIMTATEFLEKYS